MEYRPALPPSFRNKGQIHPAVAPFPTHNLPLPALVRRGGNAIHCRVSFPFCVSFPTAKGSGFCFTAIFSDLYKRATRSVHISVSLPELPSHPALVIRQHRAC